MSNEPNDRTVNLGKSDKAASAAAYPGPGSLIVERYVWTNPSSKYSAKTGVQWLAQEVDKDGNLTLLKVCKTRAEALAVICGA